MAICFIDQFSGLRHLKKKHDHRMPTHLGKYYGI